jgi:hypothetical protein
MDESVVKATSGNAQAYADELRARRHRYRVVGFSVCIALWLLSAVPLARLSSEDGGGAGVAAAYLVAGFGIAVLIRVLYALMTRRAVWSPWVFATAALLAITSYGVLSAGEKTPTYSGEATLAMGVPSASGAAAGRESGWRAPSG